MSTLTPYEAQQQIMALEKVLTEGPLPIGEFATDVVVSLVRVGLLAETEDGIYPTPAAAHYAELIEATQPGPMDRYAYYDREVDIVWIPAGQPGEELIGGQCVKTMKEQPNCPPMRFPKFTHRQMSRQTAYYDREAGIVYIGIAGQRGQRRTRGLIVCDERNWGLIDRVEGTDEVVGLEIWRPKEMFPPDLLEAIPPPVGRQFAWRLRDHWSRLRSRLWRQRRVERYHDGPDGQDAATREPPQRWHRGLPAPPSDPAEAEEYRRRHPDVNF